METFIQSVSPHELPQLRNFEIVGEEVYLRAHIRSLGDPLSRFIGGLKNLMKLKINARFFDDLLSIESLAKTAGNSLENVLLWNPDCDLKDEIDRSLSISNLGRLQSSFPCCHT